MTSVAVDAIRPEMKRKSKREWRDSRLGSSRQHRGNTTRPLNGLLVPPSNRNIVLEKGKHEGIQWMKTLLLRTGSDISQKVQRPQINTDIPFCLLKIMFDNSELTSLPKNSSLPIDPTEKCSLFYLDVQVRPHYGYALDCTVLSCSVHRYI